MGGGGYELLKEKYYTKSPSQQRQIKSEPPPNLAPPTPQPPSSRLALYCNAFDISVWDKQYLASVCDKVIHFRHSALNLNWHSR